MQSRYPLKQVSHHHLEGTIGSVMELAGVSFKKWYAGKVEFKGSVVIRGFKKQNKNVPKSKAVVFN